MSVSSASGECNIAAYIVGTPSRTVTRIPGHDFQGLGRIEAGNEA